MSVPAAHRAVAFHRRDVRAEAVNRNVNAFERLSGEGDDRDPFDARILRTQVRGKNQEEGEAPHLTPNIGPKLDRRHPLEQTKRGPGALSLRAFGR